MRKKIALVIKALIIVTLLTSEAYAQQCSINTSVNGIAGTGHTNGTIAQSFTACESGMLASVSAVSGEAATGFNQVIVEIFAGDGLTGTKLLTTGAVQVNKNRTVTWTLSGYGVQVVAGQKYTARFTTTQGSPMLKYGTGANAAIDYYPGGRVYYVGNSWNDMFFSASIQTLDDPTLNPADDAIDVSRSEEVKLTFTRDMEAVSGNITIENVTDASTQTVDVTTLNIDGGVVYMPLTAPLMGGKNYSIEIPSGALRATNGIPYGGITSGDWDFTTSTKPYATLATTSANLTNDAVIPFTLDFSDVVTGFELADLAITNGVASNLSGADDSYGFDVTPTADGEVIVSLPVDVAEAGAGNGNEATDYSLDYDGTAPTVALSSAASGTIQTSVFDIDVTFSEEVTGFETSDLQIVNADVLSSTNTNNTTFTVTLRAQAEGQITVDLGADIADDLAGNANTAAPTIIDLTYSVDLESDLLSYYPFDGNANDDVVTGFNGTVTGATLTTGFDGTTDGAYNFDGNDNISFGDSPIGSGSFTLAFWVKIPEGLTQNQLRTILGKRAVCGEGRFFEINYNNSSSTGHTISVEQRNNAGVANPVAILESVGEWTHITYVKDNDQQQSSFFINGVQQTPVAWTSTYNFENNATLKAGLSACNGAGRFMFNGDMDDIYVYGRALTEVEIDLLIPFVLQSLSDEDGSDIQQARPIELTFNKDLVQASVNTTNITATASTSGSVNIDITSTGNSVTITPTAGWPVDEDITISLSGLTAANGTILNNTDLTYSVIADEAVGMILHYPISGNVDEAIGEIANQDGTISGALFAEGIDGNPFGAIQFDGTDDLVTLGDAPISSESFSISLWVKVPDNGSTTNNTIILSKRQACSEGKMFDMSYMRSGDKVRFSASARNNAGAGGVATGFDFPVNEWTKIVFVKDNATKKYRMIVNGVLEAESNWALNTVDVENAAPIRLGNTPCNGVDGTQRYNGLMDDVRIYDIAIEPRIVTIVPAKASVDVAIDSEIAITFDRAVDVSSLEASSITISDSDDNTYTYTTAFSSENSVLTITPDVDLPRGKEFTVSVDALSAEIGSGFLAFNTTFTTIETQLLSFSPDNGTVKVDSEATITLTFDNAMNMSSLEAGIQVIGSHHGSVEGTFTMPETDEVVFTPTTPYFPNEVITVILTPELEDDGGESVGNTRTFNFRAESGEFAGATLTYELSTLTTTLATSSPRMLIPGDIDNDGDLDLIGGDDNPGTLFYFENLGSGNYGTGVIIDDNNGYFDVKVTDLDFDGDLDIVTIDRSVSQGLYWYENDGSANFTEHLVIALTNTDSRSVSIADYNGDGSLDFAVASYGSNQFRVFDQDGNQLFGAANAGQPIFVSNADLDGDGDLDVISANYTSGAIAKWTNSGAAGFGGVTLHTAANPRSVLPVDIDQDGDIDIVYSAQTASQIGVLQNDGTGNFTNVQVGSVGGPHRIDVGDADGDGDFDIVYTVAGGSSDINFYYLENSGSLTLWVAKKLIDTETFSGTWTQTVKYADVDNDGDLDVLATDAASKFYIFENMIIDLNEAPFVSNAIADQSIEEDDANGLTIDVSNVFVDNDGDSFTLSAESDNAAVDATINGDNLELDLVTADFSGDVNITVTADDGMDTNSDVFVLTVTPVNDAPVFDLSAVVVSVDEDFTTTESITVTQNQPADEDAPTYTISPTSSTVADVSIDANTGEVTITAIDDAFGSEDFTITADDGAAENNTATGEFTVTVTAVNDAPVAVNTISDLTFDEDSGDDQFMDVSTVFEDVDDATLTLSFEVLSGSDLATVTMTNGIVDVVANADAFGTIGVEVTAEDAAGLTASEAFDVMINPVNDEPVFTTSGDLSLQTDFTGTESVTVTPGEIPFGEDSQTVTYSLSPASVTFANVSINSASGEVSVTAVAEAAGEQEFTITADDGEAANNTYTQTFTLYVIDNLAPEVINTIANTTMDEDQATLSIVDVTTLFSDPESDPMTYSVSDDFNGDVDVLLNGNMLEVTPTANYNGSGTVTVSASDANQTTGTSFTLTVSPVNDTPILAGALTDQNATEDQSFTYMIPAGLFEDVDNDVITITAGSKPDWLAFDGSEFTGTPDNSAVGSSTVEVVGDDGNGASVTATFSLSVANVNDAPTLVSEVADVTVDEDAAASTIDLSSVFEDVDADDALTIVATSDASSLIDLAIANDELTITYTADVSGVANVTLTATDGSGESVSDGFVVTVNSVNDAPVFTLSETQIAAEQDFTGQLTVNITAGSVPADETDQTVTYTLTSEDSDVVTAALNGTTVEITSITESFGEQTFTVTADDGQSENNTHVMTFTVTVNKILSVGDLQEELVIYPNPVVERLFVDTEGTFNMNIYSLRGDLVKQVKQARNQVNVQNLKAGTYLIEIETDSKKFVKRIMKAN